MTTATATRQASEQDIEQTAEFLACQRSFIYFLEHYVNLREPPPGEGVIKFQPWAHLIALARQLPSVRLLVVLKARQVGVSWLFAAYALWLATFRKASTVLMISKGQDEAVALLGKAKFIYAQLPPYLQLAKMPDGSDRVGFPTQLSTIQALPSTEGAGRSETASLVICDEHAFHPHAAENYAAAKPTIDNGAQFVSLSTNDKTKSNTLFRALYQGAKAGVNGFTPVFLGYDVRPGRDTAWYEARRKEAPSMPGMTPDLFMEQEYPRTDVEAMAPARSIATFDHDKLGILQGQCREPIERRGVISIYQPFTVGGRYVAATDTSHGIGQDAAVTGVIDLATNKVVADIWASNLSPEELAYQSVELLKLYREPLWAIENNDWGQVTISAAISLGYKNFFYEDWQREGKRDEGKKTRTGWHTSQNVYLAWGELIQAVNDLQIVIPNTKAVEQLYSIIRNPEKGGKIEAAEGEHDDYAIMLAIGWQMRKYASFATENDYAGSQDCRPSHNRALVTGRGFRR